MDFSFSCPSPRNDDERIQLAHGGGGRFMHRLIEDVFVPGLGLPSLARRHDSAIFEVPRGKLAFTTDSYVVKPLFFPGGDIGSLAVNGTVNDLAMSGARAIQMSAAFIIEEGFEMNSLRRIVASMHEASRAAGVPIVTGDTKVVERGKGDGLFITTTGVGVVDHGLDISPAAIREGDAILVSGDLGRHGIAIVGAREGIELESSIESDCAPLAEPALALLAAKVRVRCLRDLTRGGLASALNEIAMASGASLHVDEKHIPVVAEVAAACELLGYDPLYVANEGRFVAFVAAEDASRALDVLRGFSVSRDAALVGLVTGPGGGVTLRGAVGADRLLDMLSGEQLPRIC